MRNFFGATLATAVLMMAMAGSANAGPANAFTFKPDPPSAVVTAVSDRVTYATTVPALETYVGFDVGDVVNNVLMTNTSGSTVNRITLKFTASIVTPGGALSQEKLTGLSISTSASACAFDTTAAQNPLTLTCQVQQLKNGATFPALTVFYKAPVAADIPSACAGSATPSTDCNTVKTQIDLVYAEGPNDQGPTGQPNSTQKYPTSGELKLVSLGTTNPSFVKSALPKGVETKFFTGTGVPTAGGAFKEFTESINLPTLAASYRYGQASIKVSDDTSAQCTNLGNFTSCPLYETTIVDPSTTPATTIQFPSAFQFVYRIDSTKLKRPLSQILTNTQIFYSSDGSSYSQVMACSTTSGLPCIDMRTGFEPTCFKTTQSAGGNAELKGDCQWILLKDSNGFVKFN